MSEENKVAMWLLSLLVFLVASIIGGCTATTLSDNNHKERMAALGYEEVVEAVVGEDHPVRYWHKKAE